MQAPDTALTFRLRVYRRRAAVVLFVRVFAVAAGISALGAEALFAFAGSAIDVRVAVAVAVAAALTAAGAWTAVGMPSLMMTARGLDNRHHLHDRTVTALQFGNHTDAFSPLVFRDAVAALAAIPAARAFPLEIPGVAYLLAALAVTAPLGTWVIQPRLGTGTGTLERSTRGAAAGGGRSGSLDGRPDVNASQEVRADAATTPVGRDIPSVPNQPIEPGSADGGPASVAAPRLTSADGTPNGAASAGAMRAGGTAAGGAHGEPAPDDAAERSPLDDDRYSSAYRSAMRSAEAALDRDTVTPEQRDYLRDYFLAIGPGAAR